VLTGCHDSSLVVDTLRDLATKQNTTVGYFYFDFRAPKELSAIGILGSLLKEMISGMEIVPEEIFRGLREHRDAFCEDIISLVDIVQMLQLITSLQPRFICIDGLDECAGVQLSRLLESLGEILEKSPGTRIFLTGMPHIRAEIEQHLPGRVACVSADPRKDDIVTYIRARLANNKTQDAMDECLEADILENTLGNISGM